MMELSIASHFSWQLAVNETLYTKQKYIEKEHIFNGICSLEKVTEASTVLINISPDSLNEIQSEKYAVEKILVNFDIKPAHLRRQIRSELGVGNYIQSERVVHRSENCKSYFKKAEDIAIKSGSNNIHCLHILSAILSDPGPHITKVLIEHGIELSQLRDKISKSEIESLSSNAKPQLGTGTILEKYGIDLTQLAKDGKLEPLIGREGDLLKLTRTLKRKKKSNPIILGDPGVGKTAIVKGLAQRISDGEVPPSLRDKKIIEINMGSLLAGTKLRGDFESRITRLIAEMQENKDIIVFIDEIHNVVGAGKAEGSLDASDILKPALAQGDIVIIGATTIEEYRKYFEKDSAMERRFQPIVIDEPSVIDTAEVIQGLKSRYEEYHNVKISNDTIKVAVELSVRYITDRRLPDKALDVIDEACSSKTVPDLSMYLNEEVEITVDDITNVIRDWTGIPVKVEADERERLLKIEEELNKKVIGQENAIQKVSRRIKRARAGIQDPKRPLGVFLFLGPTGVGKTELVKTLAEFMFYSENSIIRLDMSEYMESQSVSKLIGSAPGLVGYEEGGYLTNALKNKPYSIVLLDEIEKAHPKIFDIFLQVFDEGRITDSHGRIIDARNAIFIMTSNISPMKDYSGVAYGAPESGVYNNNPLKALNQHFRPEFLNRIDEIIQFNPLGKKQIEQIVNIINIEFKDRLLKEKNIHLDLDLKLLDKIVENGFDPDYGARFLIKTYENMVEVPLVDNILQNKVISGDKIKGKFVDDQIIFEKI